MRGIEKPIFYFEQPGYENSDDVVEIVHKRLKEGDIKSVVVASSRGETGLINRSPKMKVRLGIPADHQCYSAMTLGFPDMKYLRLVHRDPPKVEKRGKA